MTGDGVNDAPALKQADCGIAVSGATDAARSAAALILTAPGLSTIVNAIGVSRQIFQRIESYIHYRIAMTLDIMIVVVASIVFLDFQPLTAIMIVALALLDDIPIMTIAYDNVPVGAAAGEMEHASHLHLLVADGTAGGGRDLRSAADRHALAARRFAADNHPDRPRPACRPCMFLQLAVGGHLLLLSRAHQRKRSLRRPIRAQGCSGRLRRRRSSRC